MTSTPNLSFDIARRRDGVVLTVHGDVDRAASTRLGAVLADLIEGQGNLTVTLDLQGVSSLDPAALGAFTVAGRLASQRGGQLTVLPPRGERAPAAAATADLAHAHLVEFYEEDESLAESVRDWLAPALTAGDAALVVATGTHRRRFEQALVASGIDLPAAAAHGRYIGLDAEETLSQFMRDGRPVPARFASVLGDCIARASSSGRRGVRIYGEMVVVLWGAGNITAALALEDLWNDLARSHEFSLLCAYPATAFDSLDTQGSFRAICHQHSRPGPEPGPGAAPA
jgi:anti-anti-sigma factor